jgi:hypothetical protein
MHEDDDSNSYPVVQLSELKNLLKLLKKFNGQVLKVVDNGRLVGFIVPKDLVH